MIRNTILILLIIALQLIFNDDLEAQKKPKSPAKMCRKLDYKKNKKFKKKFRLRKVENDVSHITYNPDVKRTSSGPVATYKNEIPLVAKKENVPEPAKINLPPTVNEKHAKIRERVQEEIKNGESTGPFIESLYFVTDEAEFAYVDFDPFLIAVEYALQGRMVLVEGHTDNRASEKHNLELSMKRVRQIERLMLDIGVPQERISVIGYGESMPKYDNSTEEGRQKNRRVDFKIF